MGSLSFIDVTSAPYNAVADPNNNQSPAIQAALDDAARTKRNVYIPGGFYRIDQQLNFYREGGCLVGDGIQTTLLWNGLPTSAALRMVGGELSVRDLRIVNGNQGWLAGISYDGDGTNGRSTHGMIERVMIDGNDLPGDGIQLGRGGGQADMLTILHPYITACSRGNGIATYNGNVLSIRVISPTLSYNRVHLNRGTTTNITVIGGELDHGDLLFQDNGGGPLTIIGVRTEAAKRAFFNSAGAYPCSVKFDGVNLASLDDTRPTATASANAGENILRLSAAGYVPGDMIVVTGASANGTNLRLLLMTPVSPDDLTAFVVPTPMPRNIANAPVVYAGNTLATIAEGSTTAQLSDAGFAVGDPIHIEGAGPMGTVLSAQIKSMPTPTTAELSRGASNNVTGARASRIHQFGHEQSPFILGSSLGPYLFENCVFRPERNVRVSGAATFVNCLWAAGDLPNPSGLMVDYVTPDSLDYPVIGCKYGFSAPAPMLERLRTPAPLALPANETAPIIMSADRVITANTLPTAITTFRGGTNGQLVYVIVNDANTTFVNGTTLKTGTGANVAASPGACYAFLCNAGAWHMLRS